MVKIVQTIKSETNCTASYTLQIITRNHIDGFDSPSISMRVPECSACMICNVLHTFVHIHVYTEQINAQNI